MSWKQAFKTMWNCGILFQSHDKITVQESQIYFIKDDCYYPMGWEHPRGRCKVNHPDFLPEYIYFDSKNLFDNEKELIYQFLKDNYSNCRIDICRKCGLLLDTLTPAKENAVDISTAIELYKVKELEYKQQLKEKMKK